MLAVDRPPLAVADARRVFAASREDATAHAAVALLLLAGLRPQEAETQRTHDYDPEPRLRTGAPRRWRTIRIAPSAGAAVTAYLAMTVETPGVLMFPRLQSRRSVSPLVQLVRATARSVGVDAGVHCLRRAAVAEVLRHGLPMAHVERYFGVAKAPGRKELVPVPEGYDAEIAAILERTFA